MSKPIDGPSYMDLVAGPKAVAEWEANKDASRAYELRLPAIERALAALGGCDALLARLDAMDDTQAAAYLATLSEDAREGVRFLLSLREPVPDPNADLEALAKLDEDQLLARLISGGPELRARFADYLRDCEIADDPARLDEFLAAVRNLQPRKPEHIAQPLGKPGVVVNQVVRSEPVALDDESS
jgi:hypothetical protein